VTQASPVTELQPKSQLSAPVRKLIFLDWPQEVGSLPQASLFDETDLSQYDIVFFDPYQFALAHGLRSKSKRTGEVEYVDQGEREFLKYLKQVKAASESLQKFLKKDGLLVIRAHIPKSHIKVRKKSTASVRKYTESVISAFFWLDEIIGRCSFQDCVSKFIKYRQEDHPIKEGFGDCVVESFQSQASIGKGHVNIIGVGGSSGKSPLITNVSYGSGRGQIYFIPRFMVKDETLKLKQVFEKIAATGVHRLIRPSWLSYYEEQIKDYNPHRTEIERIDLEIENLMERRSALTHQVDDVSLLTHLLHESGARLLDAARVALRKLGFDAVDSTRDSNHKQLSVRVNNQSNQKLVIRLAGPCVEAVPHSEVDQLVDALGEYTAQVSVKGVLVGNGMASHPPDKRDTGFDSESIETARRYEICLLPVYDLFTAASLILSRHRNDNIEMIKAAIRKDIVECDGLYAINRPKYGI